MYNTGHIKALKEAIAGMRKAHDVIAEYCTHKCKVCPLTGICDWDGYIEYNSPKITDGLLDRFVDLYEEVTDRQERKTFKEATGIDPAWYDFNDDRSE